MKNTVSKSWVVLYSVIHTLDLMSVHTCLCWLLNYLLYLHFQYAYLITIWDHSSVYSICKVLNVTSGFPQTNASRSNWPCFTAPSVFTKSTLHCGELALYLLSSPCCPCFYLFVYLLNFIFQSKDQDITIPCDIILMKIQAGLPLYWIFYFGA